MKTITPTEWYRLLCLWKNHHMKVHGVSEQEALKWAQWNVENPPGPGGSACESVEIKYVG